MPEQKIDAILVPFAYPLGVPDGEKSTAFNREFGPILGSPRVWSIKLPTLESRLLVATPHNHTVTYPDTHPLAKQFRHDWVDRGDGVKFGMLKEDVEPEPTQEASIASAQKAFRSQLDELKAKPKPTEDDRKAIKRIEKLLATWEAKTETKPVEPAPAVKSIVQQDAQPTAENVHAQ